MENTPKRIINWWLNWEDLNWPSMDISDKIKRRAEQAAQANVTTAILFGCHFRWDYLPYFTLLHDHIATTCEELRKYGIELYDRHSVNLIHRYDTKEQMRHVMLHSGPHIPFSPSREAAKSWQYKGKFLNDWRMIDVKTHQPLYYPQYAGEGFCYRNPEFVEAYCDYAKNLIADTGISGLAAEDPVHYMHFSSCACPHCRAELKRRTGVDLPDISDSSFWGNWENPAWLQWIDMRLESSKEFFEKLIPELPEGFIVTTCGGNSPSNHTPAAASDASRFIAGGSNYVHMELCGNTPPYPKDKVTTNSPMLEKMVGFSHHQAVARDAGLRAFSTGYGFTETSANIIWAVNKLMDTDCCFSTLKARLGLPEHMLKELPEEPELVKAVYTFEKNHPQLFVGRQLAQVGVFFSSETRDNTMFGSLTQGYYKDYAETLRLLSKAGINAQTLLQFPQDANTYPVIVLTSVARMTDDEQAQLHTYIRNGGKVVACGPTVFSECGSTWELPTSPKLDKPEDFFSTIRDGVWIQIPKWMSQTKLSPSQQANRWQEIVPGIYYNPHRVSDGEISDSLLDTVKALAAKLPVQILSCQGYFTAIYRCQEGYNLHFLAEAYDTDIDHRLDDIRFHRSRVNYVNRAIPVGVSRRILLSCINQPEVFTPFEGSEASVVQTDSGWEITLSSDTAYLVVHIPQ